MKKITTITKKGQVTIPQIVREKLQVGYGDKVEFTLNDRGEIVIQPVKADLDSIYGVLEDNKPELDLEKQREATRDWIGNQKGRS